MAWAVPRSLRRVLRVALALGGAAVLAAAAEAQSDVPERDWLHWQGPLECQNTREVERQIESLLGHAPDPAQLPSTRVEVGWALERGWNLRIRVALPHGERRREVDVRTCADGFDVVALTLALILDPDLQLGENAALDPEGTPGLATASSEPASLPPDATLVGAAALGGANAGTLDLVPLTPSETVEPGAGPGRAFDAAPALALSVSGRADFGSLPSSLYGGGLELSLLAWQWRLDAGGAFLGKAGDTLPTARYPVSYSNLFGLLRGCRQFGGDRGGHFGLCLGGQLGSLAATEMGGERRHPRGPWAAADLGAEMGLDLNETWGAFSRMELVFPLIHHELELAGGSVVHELPTVSIQLTLGAVVKLTEWASP
ncbi:MAG: hypothetical protein ABI895_00950 [Deltaproteobacteria bacterium]